LGVQIIDLGAQEAIIERQWIKISDVGFSHMKTLADAGNKFAVL
jgi:hypothetical protein